MTKKETIIDARQKLDLSQEEFGKLLFVKRSTVSMWEQGKRKPSDLTIREVLRLLEANKKTICFWTEINNNLEPHPEFETSCGDLRNGSDATTNFLDTHTDHFCGNCGKRIVFSKERS